MPTVSCPTALSSAVFDFVRPHGVTLKHIPKGARARAASSFERRINAVLSKPDDWGAWSRLLSFGACLTSPGRGGRRRNLTSQVLAAIDKADLELKVEPAGAGPSRPSPTTRRKATVSADETAARRASSKLAEGDIRGAVRSLCSDDTFAPPGPSTRQSLLTKHPPAPTDRRPPPPLSVPAMSVSSDDVSNAIRSFAPGSSGAVDGLRPQHMTDMLGAVTGGSLLGTLTEFTNLVLGGGVPEGVRPTFFGASLHAFQKKDGGIRPIAVGMSLRRLVAKCANTTALGSCAPMLAPRQLGVGAKGGGEALAHAARAYTSNMSTDKVFVKLDFTNAFNSVRRDSVLEAVAAHRPDLLPFTLSAYGSSSHLWSGDDIILSSEGVQQGDPLGPLLFCLALHEPLQQVKCEFLSGYLDDIGMADSIDQVIQDTVQLERAAELVGLQLNHAKCQVIGITDQTRPTWVAAGLKFEECTLDDASLLGSPLSVRGVDNAVLLCQKKLETALPRLYLMSAHESLFLLKNSLAVPRLQFTLRTAPCFVGSSLKSFDGVVRSALSRSLNLAMDDQAWEQASLPVRWGGLGVRSAEALSTSAYLSSRAASQELMGVILPATFLSVSDQYAPEARRRWDESKGIAPPDPGTTIHQRAWDDAFCSAKSQELRGGATPETLARLLACSSDGSGSWLHALPSATLGLRLSNEEVRIAVGLRLGAPIVRPHTCQCGQAVLANGVHGLSCKKSAGRHLRHSLANDVIARAFRSADTPADLEPTGLLRGDGKRPDGATRIPWSHGKCLLWDFTCPDTLAPSHIPHSSTAAGSAAGEAESRKISKYSALLPSFDFSPVAIETLGAWGPGALAFVKDLGSRIASTSGEPRSSFFLRQRLDIAVQRGNAVAVRGTVVVDTGTLLDY